MTVGLAGWVELISLETVGAELAVVKGAPATGIGAMAELPCRAAADANGMLSWGLLLWLLGFKGAVQLQIAMENGPFACRVLVATL